MPARKAISILKTYGEDLGHPDFCYMPEETDETDLVSSKEKMEDPSQHEVHVYPNPASDFVRIEWQGDPEDEQVFIHITNLKGQAVAIKRWENLNETIELNTTRFSKGVYMVNIVSESKVLGHSKLIVK